MRLETALNALTVMTPAEQVDPVSLTRRAAQLQSLIDSAKIAAGEAVSNRDAQPIAQSLQVMALNMSRLRDDAQKMLSCTLKQINY